MDSYALARPRLSIGGAHLHHILPTLQPYGQALDDPLASFQTSEPSPCHVLGQEAGPVLKDLKVPNREGVMGDLKGELDFPGLLATYLEDRKGN